MKKIMTALMIALVLPALAVESGTETRVEYIADGIDTTFDFTFKVVNPAHVEVYVNGVKQTTGYTVALTPAQVVTFTVPPADDAAVMIQRMTPRKQETVLAPYSSFKAKTVEGMADNSIRQIQEVDRRVADAEAAHAGFKVAQDAISSGIRADLTAEAASRAGADVDLANQRAAGDAAEAATRAAADTAETSARIAGDQADRDFATTLANGILAGTGVIPQEWTATGDGSTVRFPIAGAELSSAAMYLVTLSGVTQKPTTDYSIDLATDEVVFTAAPGSGVPIAVRAFGYSRGVNEADTSLVTATGSTTARALKDRAADVLDLEDFSSLAVGGDWTAALQAASNAAPGKTLRVKGTYRVGSVTLAGNATYDFRGAAFISMAIPGTSLLAVSGVSDVTILGGRFYGDVSSPTETDVAVGRTYVAGTAIHVKDGASRVTVDGSRFDGLWTGVNVYDSSDVTVVNTRHINGNAAIGIVAANADVRNVKVNHNTIIGGGDDGIAFLSKDTAVARYVDHCEAVGNYIDKSAHDGATLAAVGIRAQRDSASALGLIRSITISHNTMKDMVTQGIRVSDIEDSVIANNVIRGFGRGAVGATSAGMVIGQGTTRFATRVQVAGNIVTGGGGTNKAIESDPVQDSTFSGNVLRGSIAGFGALDLHRSLRNLIVGNHVENAAGVGIRTGDSSDANRIVSNIIPVYSSLAVQALGPADVVLGNSGADDEVYSFGGSGIKIRTGTGSPEGSVTAAPGSLYLNLAGGASVAQYQKTTGTGNTGWRPIVAVGRSSLNTPANGGTVTPSLVTADYYAIAAVGGTSSLTVAAPTGTIVTGQTMEIMVRNQSGGALATTWNAAYKMAAWTDPANGYSRHIRFRYDGTNWIEAGRTPADVPN